MQAAEAALGQPGDPRVPACADRGGHQGRDRRSARPPRISGICAGPSCEIADDHGLKVIAASTHPFAEWSQQQITDKDRYQMLANDLQQVVRRLVICGMHVHVGIEDPDMRIDLMNQVSYFLPHLLALTTSSPFWHGHRTGSEELPDERVPGHAPDRASPALPLAGVSTSATSNAVVGAGLIEDATKLWWDIRPSNRYPTLEMRMSDICTRVEDGIAVAALYHLAARHPPRTPARQSAVAHLQEHAGVGEHLAGPALRVRRTAGRFRQGESGPVPGTARGDHRTGDACRRGTRLSRRGAIGQRHPGAGDQRRSATAGL